MPRRKPHRIYTLPNNKVGSHGFTLLEIIIVITVVSLIFGLGMRRLLDFNKVQNIKGAGANLKNTIRVVQNKALSSLKPSGLSCRDGLDLSGYSMQWFEDTNLTQIDSICGGSLSNNETEYKLSKDVIYDNSGTIEFYVLGKGASSNQTITIRGYTNPTYYYSLCISTGGNIKDCGYGVGAVPTCVCP